MDAHRGVFDGVPAYWSPGPGLAIGSIMFRVGFIDEHLLQRGLSHLIEHLALAELDVDFVYNGETTIATTSFYARGTAEEVKYFIEHVANGLANLPWHRLETEASVLNAEASQRGESELGNAAFAVFGPAHLGLLDTIELAHDQLDRAQIDHWRRTYFTKENCALWFSGPQPLAVNLAALPPGRRMPSPEPQRIVPTGRMAIERHVQSPFAFTSAPRSFELTLGQAVLSRRINDCLRNDLGAAYGASCGSVHYSGPSTFVMLQTQASPNDAAMVYQECAYEISKLAYDGPTNDELAWYVEQFARQAEDPLSGPAKASASATNELLGARTYTDQETIDHISALDATSVGNVIATLGESLLWILPSGAPIGDMRLGSVPRVQHEKLKGKKFHRAKGATKQERYQRLHVVPEGVTFVLDAGDVNGPTLTLLRHELIGGYQFRDGQFLLWASTGNTFVIDPADWDESDKLIAAVTELLPSECWVAERDFSIKQRSRFDHVKAAS